MANMIEATFPGRPGLILKASVLLPVACREIQRPVPGDDGENATYWVRAEQDGHITWEVCPAGRAWAAAIASGAIYRLMRGCSVEGLSDPDFMASLADLQPRQEEALASAGAQRGWR